MKDDTIMQLRVIYVWSECEDLLLTHTQSTHTHTMCHTHARTQTHARRHTHAMRYTHTHKYTHTNYNMYHNMVTIELPNDKE